MATMTNDITVPASRTIGVRRLALTGALSAAIFYIFCWIGAQTPIGPATHRYLTLYTNADLTSATSLVEGTLWSLGAGLIMGGLIAFIYNALAALDRR